ncbi:terminase [Delftia sp. DS1230]|uniref:terminase n=1 Tax=Delftia sp. DS1230 TaxID=3153805 RepID=UPI0032D901F1
MAARVHSAPLNRLPDTPEELERCLRDPEWRLFSGCLYKIMVKGDSKDGEEADTFTMPFRPNRAQKRFISRLWHRNIILKARQLGFTTLIAILWLDHALFNADQRCGIIAHDREAAEAIFRDKVKYAYENLPEEIRDRFPLARDSAVELLFAHNNSSVRVATSMRSGTIHRLHVSELGKISARFPHKAKEVMTGSIPAVPTTGILVIESTAEGANGEFYHLSQRAEALHYTHKKLSPRDYRFHFYAWWQEPNYRMDAGLVHVAREQHDYFDQVEVEMQCTIDLEQRAWYVATQEADFPGAPERMWQEYPSTPAEAFQQSSAGRYYAKAMVALTKRGGITSVPELDLPVYTFWDIGRADGTAIWFMQSLRGEDRFINYYEEHEEDLRHYVRHLQGLGYVFGAHFLPHDANHKRLGDTNRSTKQQLQALMPGQKFTVVPRITELQTGVNLVRKHLRGAWFDKDSCAFGLERLRGYSKKFSRALNKFIDEPDKSNGCTEGADALRQWAQAKESGLFNPNDDGYGARAEPEEEEDAPDWRA